MKKLLVVALAAVGLAAVKKRYDGTRAEQALWAEATDSVDRA